jgi:hypothetical protein
MRDTWSCSFLRHYATCQKVTGLIPDDFNVIFNSLQVEIKSRLKIDNACYYSVQNLLSSRLLPKNLKIKIYRTIILPGVFYGCEAWSMTLREFLGLRGTR